MKYCYFSEKYLKLFKQKNGALPDKKDIFEIVMWSDADDICGLYEECFDDDKEHDLKLKNYIFSEMLKITGTEFVFVYEHKIKKCEGKIPLLHICIEKNIIPFVCMLIKGGANLHSKTHTNRSIFHTCVIFNDDPTLLNYLLGQKNIKFDEFDNKYDTPLCIAVQDKKIDFAKILIQRGANLLAKNCEDICPVGRIAQLMLCECGCEKGELLELLRMILKMENTNYEVKKYFIDESILKGKPTVFEIIIEECPQVIDEFDILSRLIESNNIHKDEVLDLLIKSNKYDSQYTNYYGITLLDYLLMFNYVEHVQYILSNNTDLLTFEKENYKKHHNNNKIYTLFEYLFIKDNIIVNDKISNIHKPNSAILELLNILIKYGLDINEKYFGYYPIEYAIKYCCPLIVKKLIDLGANIHYDIINKQCFSHGSNQDLLALAVQYNSHRCVELLIENGVKENYIYISENEKVPTAIIMAIIKDNDEMFQYLYLKYIDPENENIKNYLSNVVQLEANLNQEEFKDVLNCEFDYDVCLYIDRTIQRFIPCVNVRKTKTYVQLYQFTLLVTGFLDLDNYMHIWDVMDNYNNVMELIAPNYELLNSFVNIITFIGEFRSDYIIKKYLCIIDNLINDHSNNKTPNWGTMHKFIQYVHREGYINNFARIKSFSDGVKFKYGVTSNNELFNNICDKKGKLKFDNFEIFTCNDYNCKKCQNIFFKENRKINYSCVFEKCKFHKIINITNTYDKNITNIDKIITNIDKNIADIVDIDTDSIDTNVSKNKNKNKNEKQLEVNTDEVSPKVTSKKIKSTKNIPLPIDECCEQDIKLNVDPTIKLNIDSEDATMFDLKKKLFKLFFPVKLEHYDMIFNQLCEKPIYTENEKEICFEYNNKVYTLFKNANTTVLKPPDNWIRYYASNIGKIEKCDFNHDIPFWIDPIIPKINCHMENISDINNENMMCKLYYFYGSIKSPNYLVSGVFEYFLNGTGTLFHRMFRQYYKLSPQLQLLFAKINIGLR